MHLKCFVNTLAVAINESLIHRILLYYGMAYSYVLYVLKILNEIAFILTPVK